MSLYFTYIDTTFMLIAVTLLKLRMVAKILLGTLCINFSTFKYLQCISTILCVTLIRYYCLMLSIVSGKTSGSMFYCKLRFVYIVIDNLCLTLVLLLNVTSNFSQSFRIYVRSKKNKSVFYHLILIWMCHAPELNLYVPKNNLAVILRTRLLVYFLLPIITFCARNEYIFSFKCILNYLFYLCKKVLVKKIFFFCYFKVNLIEKEIHERFLHNVHANFLFY